MILETLYSINDVVWSTNKQWKRLTIECPACSGSGSCTLDDGKDRVCPECYGRRTVNGGEENKWSVGHSLTIGQVRAKVTNFEKDDMFDNVGHYKEGSEEYEHEYMCYETGIGSGTVYKEENLFSSREEAQAECDKENEL